MKESAFGQPDYVVQLVVSPGEEKQPLVLTYVGRSPPVGVTLEDLDVPSPSKGILDLVRDEFGVGVEVLGKEGGPLLHDLEHELLLAFSNSWAPFLELGPDLFAKDISFVWVFLQGDKGADFSGLEGESLDDE